MLHQISAAIPCRKAYVCGQVCFVPHSGLVLLYQVSYTSCSLDLKIPKDIWWWQIFLPHYNGVSLIPTSPWSILDAVFAPDACLSECGGMSSTEYFHSVFPDFIATVCTGIRHLELLVVMVPVHLWGQYWRGRRIQLSCDKEAVVSIINTGRTKDAVLAPACAKSGCNLLEGSLNCVQSTSLLKPTTSQANTSKPTTLTSFWLLLPRLAKWPILCPSNACSSSRFYFQVWWHSLIVPLQCINDLRQGLQLTRRAAYADGTHKNHQTRWRAFLLFCGYFQWTPLPASLETLCLYCQFLNRSMTPASVRNYVSGVKLLHLLAGKDISLFKVINWQLFSKDSIAWLNMYLVGPLQSHRTF